MVTLIHLLFIHMNQMFFVASSSTIGDRLPGFLRVTPARRQDTIPDRTSYRNVAREPNWSNSHIPIIPFIRWDEKAGLRGMRYAPNVRPAQGTKKRRPAMKKTSTIRVNGNMIFKGHKLTIGLDLGDRWSFYCVLDEAGEVLLEQKV